MFQPEPVVRLLKLSVVLYLLAVTIRVLPLVDEGDDRVRYYFGGHATIVRLTGSPERREDLALVFRQARAMLNSFELSRFDTAATPYAPLNVLLVWTGEKIWKILPFPVSAYTYILGFCAATWLIWLMALFAVGPGLVGQDSRYWFIVVFLVIGMVFPSTRMLSPFPRTIAATLTAMGLCLLVTRKKVVLANGVLALASFAHPYQQAVNLVVVTLVGIVLWPRRVKQFATKPDVWVTVLLQWVILAGWAVVIRLLTPSGIGDVSHLLGSDVVDQPLLSTLKVNLSKLFSQNRCLHLIGSVALATGAALVHTNWRVGLRVALLLVALALTTLFLNSGFYPAEYLSRFLLSVNCASLCLLLLCDSRPLISRFEELVKSRPGMATLSPPAARVLLIFAVGMLVYQVVMVPRRMNRNSEQNLSRVEKLMLTVLDR